MSESLRGKRLCGKGPGRGLALPWPVEGHSARLQDDARACSAEQLQDLPQVQPEPQVQDLVCVAQPQDWPQVQGLPSHSLFIGTSRLMCLDGPHLPPDEDGALERKG